MVRHIPRSERPDAEPLKEDVLVGRTKEKVLLFDVLLRIAGIAVDRLTGRGCIGVRLESLKDITGTASPIPTGNARTEPKALDKT
jgi:hypothetical protein